MKVKTKNTIFKVAEELNKKGHLAVAGEFAVGDQNNAFGILAPSFSNVASLKPQKVPFTLVVVEEEKKEKFWTYQYRVDFRAEALAEVLSEFLMHEKVVKNPKSLYLLASALLSSEFYEEETIKNRMNELVFDLDLLLRAEQAEIQPAMNTLSDEPVVIGIRGLKALEKYLLNKLGYPFVDTFSEWRYGEA